MRCRACLFALALVGLSVSGTLASVIHVPADRPTIQAGIDAALPLDTVMVAPGSYVESLTYRGKFIAVMSSGGAPTTHITSPASGQPIVSFVDYEMLSLLQGFTLHGTRNSPAVISNPGWPTIRGNIFRNNSANDGAAIRCVTGEPVIDSNWFLGNTSLSDGGAVHVYGRAVITRNWFDSNYSDGWAGALRTEEGVSLVSHNLFTRNRCRFKGGAYQQSHGGDSVINNTFYRNEAGEEGSAAAFIFSFSHRPVFLNNIVALGDTTAVFASYSTVTCDYNDFYLNNFADAEGVTLGADNVFGDPEFLDTLLNDFRLAPSSICINSGHPGPEYYDPDGSRNDIGAFPRLCDLSILSEDCDQDGISNGDDNCPAHPDTAQVDSDGDGIGDLCDNCPGFTNPAQEDTDGDGRGDECDLCPGDPYNDWDGDGACGGIDNCPTISNPDQADGDADGIGDHCDNCLGVVNPDQADTNWNDIGDACECACDFHGDPGENGIISDMIDVLKAIETAFDGDAPVFDPNPLCRFETSDVDCSGTTDLVDVVLIINVAFRSADPTFQFCVPCPQ